MTSNPLLQRRVIEIIDAHHLELDLKSGRKLRIKLGIDPTGAELHLGHAVALRKLREFQDAGHIAVFIVGDWTAVIGDPSGKDKTRQGLTEAQIKQNARHFFDQANLILDKDRTEVHLQSEWFKGFGLKEVIHLESLVTEQQILAHETFRQRLKKDLPFLHHETLYPLLQGYDSVAVRADVELGAMEQKFNLLMGRVVQRAYGQEPQDVMMLKYLIGLDGKEKMSKTLNNYIALTDSAAEMFGKVMSIPDKLIIQYFELCTDTPDAEIASMAAALKKKSVNPRDLKAKLGTEIAKLYHGEDKALEAREAFEKKFGKQKSKENVKADYDLSLKQATSVAGSGTYTFNGLLNLLVRAGLASSNSDARRKIEEGAVKINGQKFSSNSKSLQTISKNDLISLGKRFLRIQ